MPRSSFTEGNFDPYGESLAATPGEAAHASPLLSRVGQSVFWLLAIAVVVARVFFFSAVPHF